MVTVRTYLSLAQASLAKTLLDNYEIPCALLDENASFYNSGQQFAVPIRLVVDENEVDRAICILNNDFEKAAEIECVEDVEAELPAPSEEIERRPWELLIIAFYLLVPAICLILTKFPNEIGGRWGHYMIARVTIAKFLSWLAVLSAAGLVFLYFRVRRRSESNGATNPVQQNR
jgi:hypothetical protein